MRKWIGTWVSLLLCNTILFAQGTKSPAVMPDPAFLFTHPPESAKPGVLWMWMGSNINKAAITRDLEALKKEGFNSTTMVSLSDITNPWNGVIGKSPTPQIVAWTEPWWRLVRYAAEESRRLGMDFGMSNGAGYESNGGTWITPELSMQEICWNSRQVSGDTHLALQLEKPAVNPRANMQFPVFNPATGLTENPVIPERKTFYKDIAVLALPANGVVTKDSVIDLTTRMLSDGRLEWDAPAGEWTIYRFGHTTMGSLIQPAQPEATGLECDKINPEAIGFHLDHIIGEIKRHLGDLAGTVFTHLYFDSYEAGEPTWTPKMPGEFLKRRGYDLLPYLPTFAGRIIGSRQDSAKFRNDFAGTIRDLYRDVYFTVISKKLKEANLVFLCEPYGGPWRPDEVTPLVHRAMVEFWTNKGVYTPYLLGPTVAAWRNAGGNIIVAEAFTGQPEDSKWSEYPAWLKPIGDAAFCAGVNRLIVHRFAHQPWDQRYKPGAAMGQWGTHFDRTQTWWKPGAAMVRYWQRCQALLQWGGFVPEGVDDFEIGNITDSITLRHIRRTDGTTDIYFVANTAHRAGTATCTFKITGRQPELWDPVTGRMKELSRFEVKDETTILPLNFDDAQSFFIVFRKKTGKLSPEAGADFSVKTPVMAIDGPWQVRFDSAWGGPARPVTFPALEDWTARAEKGIRYFSGTAVYHTSFNAPASLTAGKPSATFLDLGVVKYIARVRLNNIDLGVVWTAPWQIAIPAGILKSKDNKLDIEVTNVWANRLIGDEQEPPDCEWLKGYYYYYCGTYLKEFPDWFLKKQPRPSKGRYCFTTWNYFDKDSPLMPSGLLGPVRIMREE